MCDMRNGIDEEFQKLICGKPRLSDTTLGEFLVRAACAGCGGLLGWIAGVGYGYLTCG